MTFVAKYDGRCGGCGETIHAGDKLDWDELEVVHADCLRLERAKPKRDTCPDCWQEKSTSGACGCDPA